LYAVCHEQDAAGTSEIAMSPPAETAFVPLGSSSFMGVAAHVAPTHRATATRPARVPVIAMAKGDKKKIRFSLPNPFAKKPAVPQPGDPSYKSPKFEKFEIEDDTLPGPPSKNKAKSEAAKAEAEAATLKAAKKTGALPVVSGIAEIEEKKRGLDLLRQDFLKSAPERAGIGRQDETNVSSPSFGEPGYKKQAFETAKVSTLGISPFPDDANAVGKVGGLEAVQKAARLAAEGKSEKAIKAKFLKKEVVVPVKEQVFDIPDYLKPIPEDTVRKGYTWKNYIGR
jgi:hypothetical protein